MKKLLLSFSTIIALNCFAQNNFISAIGTGGYDYLSDVIQTADGGYIATGYTDNNNGSDGSFYVIKIDANGQQVWNKIIAGLADDDQGYGITNTSDGGFAISGIMNDKMGVFKFDASGTLSWSKQYNYLLSGGGTRILQTSDGGFLIPGAVSPDDHDRYFSHLVKTDANGNVQWSKKYFDTYYSVIYDLKKTNDGNYVFLAINYYYNEANDEYSDDTTYIVKINTSGSVLWSKYFTSAGGYTDGYNLLPVSDGGYLVTGFEGNTDMGFMVKVDASGNYKWSKAVNGDGYYLYASTETSDGGYVAIGSSFGSGTEAIYLCKVNSAGTTVWTKEIQEDANFEYDLEDLLKTSDGGYIAVGTSYDANSNTEPAVFMKFDANFNTCIPAISAAGLTNFGVFGNTTVPVSNTTTTVSNASIVVTANGTFTNICTALPLTLLDFTATPKTKAVALAWKTAEERNTAYFDVEKSLDAKTFTSLSQVKAAGNSTTIKTYEAADNNPTSGDNWYRLKMVDKDGKFAYSNAVKVTFTGKSNMQVYPNPAVNNATITFTAEKAGTYSIQITDMYGKVLHTIKGVATVGENKINLPVSSYAKGMYLVNIKTETSKSALKLNKQ